MNFHYPDGATPLDPKETFGLRLVHISTRAELDRWEQNNITVGEAWAFARRQKDIPSDGFVRRLRKRMFGTVWRWWTVPNQRQEHRGLGGKFCQGVGQFSEVRDSDRLFLLHQLYTPCSNRPRIVQHSS